MKKITYFYIIFMFFSGEVLAMELSSMQAYGENFPPYSFEENGRLTGFSVELLRAIAKQADIDIDINKGPWKRFLKKVTDTPNTILLTATRNEGREDKFKWFGPIYRRSIKLYKLTESVKDWKMNINQSSNDAVLQSIKNGQYAIGAVSGDASEKNLKKQGYKVYSSPMQEHTIRQLFAGRIPITIEVDLAIAAKLRKEGRSFSEVEEIAVFDDRYSYYFMVNKDTDSDVVYQLQKALDILKYNGIYDELKNRWLTL